jgi:hypothetical protein
MRRLSRTLLLISALTVPGLVSGCFYSHTTEKTPAVVTTTPDTSSSTTTTTTTDDGQVERRSTTTYSNP